MSQQIEKIILRNLIHDEEYARKVLPYLKDEYFVQVEDKALFIEIANFLVKYNKSPTYDALELEISNLAGQKESTIQDVLKILVEFKENNEKQDINWLLEVTEKFCQDKAIYLALMDSIEIMNNKKGSLSRGAIPNILSEALAVTFDPTVGLDYLEDADARYEFYHNVLERIPFDIDFLNTITKNGLPKKTLTIFMGDTGGGKSLAMCHIAAAALTQGKNVLYVTFELSQEEVGKRIDANLMNITLDDLMELPKDAYLKRVEKIKSKTNGKLFVKEYPNGGASILNIEALLDELKLKKNFVPEIVFIDYINIMASSRRNPGNSSSYEYIKSIAEEVRGLGIKRNLAMVSATQTNRSGFASSDVDLDNVSESWGLPATADLFIALINSEEMIKLGQIMMKQLKNRLGDPNKHKLFILGIDRSKMKLYNLEDSAQQGMATGNLSKPTPTPIPSIGSNPKGRFSGIKI